MKKTTKLQKVAVESDPEPDKPKRGPTKEKTQITIRLDKQLLDDAYIQMKEADLRITDIIERGIYLALRERDHDMSDYTKQVRFVLANATREQQVLIRGLAIAMVEGEVTTLTPEVNHVAAFCKWYLESRNKVAHAHQCLKIYSRYGKSAAEVAKLGTL